MMSSRKILEEVFPSFESFVHPTECLRQIVTACADYGKIAQEESTKRREIQAWEKATVAKIKAQRDLLMKYLDHSFDERSENFKALFLIVDRAIETNNNEQLTLALHSITELAKSSPFKDFASLSSVQAALNDPNHTWEF